MNRYTDEELQLIANDAVMASFTDEFQDAYARIWNELNHRALSYADALVTAWNVAAKQIQRCAAQLLAAHKEQQITQARVA